MVKLLGCRASMAPRHATGATASSRRHLLWLETWWMPTSLLHPELLAVRPDNMMLLKIASQLHPHGLKVGVASWRSHHLLVIWRPTIIRFVVLTKAFSSTVRYSSSQTTVAASPPSWIVQLTLEKRCPGTFDDVDNTINAIAQTSVGLKLYDS